MKLKMIASVVALALLSVSVARADDPEKEKAKIRQAATQTRNPLVMQCLRTSERTCWW